MFDPRTLQHGMIAAYVFGGCLQVVAWSVLLDGAARSPADIFLSVSVVVILSVILLGKDTYLKEVGVLGMPLGAYLISVVIGFLLFRIAPVDSGSGTLFWLRLGALVIAAISALFVVASIRDRAITAKWGAIAITAALSVISFLSVYHLDLNNDYGDRAKWSAGLFWMVMSISSFMATTSLSCRPLLPWLSRFLVATVVVSILVAGVGMVRMGEVVYHYRGAVDSFKIKQYDEFHTHSADLVEAGNEIGIGAYALKRVVDGVATVARIGGGQEALSVLGTTAIKNRLWSTALDLYGQGKAAGESRAADRANYNLALFETGRTVRAIENMLVVDRKDDLAVLDLVSLTLLQLRVRDFPAVQANGRDIYQTLLDPLLFSEGQNVVYGPIGDVFPDSLLSSITDHLSLYALVRAIEVAGGRVFHPGEKIGSTDIIAPIDIEALSGGGDTWMTEEIWIGGRRVSPMRRGYNLAVLEPASGSVVDTVSFDTWENRSEGLRMAEYLRLIPYGQIVVGAVRDEGSEGLVGQTKDEMRKLGVNYVAPHWGSHCFIGVKGAMGLQVVEGIGEQNNPVSVGVLGSNIDDVLPGSRDDLVRFLTKEAESASAGFAVYLSGVEPEDVIGIVRR